jgi:hypothetical protein
MKIEKGILVDGIIYVFVFVMVMVSWPLDFGYEVSLWGKAWFFIVSFFIGVTTFIGLMKYSINNFWVFMPPLFIPALVGSLGFNIPGSYLNLTQGLYYLGILSGIFIAMKLDFFYSERFSTVLN